MKHKITLLSILLATVFNCFSQPVGNRFKFRYVFKSSTLGKVYKLTNGGATYSIPSGEKFSGSVIRESSGNLLVTFWKQTNVVAPTHPAPVGITYLTSGSPGSAYRIELTDSRGTIADPVYELKLPFRGYSFGVSTIPFRYRFRTSINSTTKTNETVSSPRPDLAISYGYVWGHTRFSAHGQASWPKSVSIFVGATAAEIKNGVVKSESQLYGGSKVQINPAATYGVQFFFGRNNLGIVAAIGFESSIGVYSTDWVYQNKPFLGIGIATSPGLF